MRQQNVCAKSYFQYSCFKKVDVMIGLGIVCREELNLVIDFFFKINKCEKLIKIRNLGVCWSERAPVYI